MNIANQIIELDEAIRSGSLCIFGCWFGRPMDNYHISTKASLDGDVLKITFKNGEILEVTEPSNFIVDGIILKIPAASKVKWSWYCYGEPKSLKTLMYYEYTVTNGKIISRTNSPWPTNPVVGESAVELC